MIGVKATLVDGSCHPVDSTEPAFSMAAGLALRDAIEKVGVVLLEPIMRLEVTVPNEYLGDVITNLNGRRADLGRMDLRGKARVVRAMVPLAEMFGYSTTLRSLTQGRAGFTLEPCAYRRVPAEIAAKLI